MAPRSLPLLLALTAASAGGRTPLPDRPPDAPPRKRVALALSGGGAYGLLYLGALEWMERHRIPVDAIAGTSGGALVGGWYATGLEFLSDEEILHPVEPRGEEELRLRGVAPIISQIDFEHLFDSGPDYRNLDLPQKRERRRYPNDLFAGLAGIRGLRRDGLVPGQTVGYFLDWIGRDYGEGLDRLPTPLRIVAVDAADPNPKRWRAVIMGGPNPDVALGLSRSIRASIAVPALLAPVEAEGRRLIDGAVLDNLPTDVAIDAFAPDVLIGLRWDNGYGPDPYRAGRGGREPGEKLLVTFDPRPYRVDQFGRWRELAWLGYRQMAAHRAELERYALSPEAYLAYRRGRRARPFDRHVIRVEGDVPGLEGVRRAVVGRDLDDLAATRALGQALDRLVADRSLATAGYDLRPGGLLVVRTTRHRGGPAFVRAAVEAEIDSGDRPWAGASVRVSDLRPNAPAYSLDLVAGTTPALTGTLELPIGPGLSIGPAVRMDRETQFRFRGPTRRSEAAISTAEGSLGLFYRPSRSFELSLGAFGGANGSDEPNGVAFDPQTGFYGGVFARAELDETDDPVAPRRGSRATLAGREFDQGFRTLTGSVETFFGPTADAWGLRAEFGSGFGTDVPFPLEFRPRLEPYRRDEIRGDGFLLLGVSRTRPIAPLPFALGRTFMVGRIENAWTGGRTYPGATLTLLADTRIGAASLGLGIANHGALRLLLGLGRRF